jgi:hypothetical protein
LTQQPHPDNIEASFLLRNTSELLRSGSKVIKDKLNSILYKFFPSFISPKDSNGGGVGEVGVPLKCL